jgi:hypothetical protein
MIDVHHPGDGFRGPRARIHGPGPLADGDRGEPGGREG